MEKHNFTNVDNPLECASHTKAQIEKFQLQKGKRLSSFIFDDDQKTCKVGIVVPFADFPDADGFTPFTSGLYVKEKCVPPGILITYFRHVNTHM